jgi:DEAD/DEAH box helicase domain-containing protein
MANITKQIDLFADPGAQLPVRRSSLEAAVAKFQELMAQPNSPIRAVHHLPARAAAYAPFPENLDSRLKQMLAGRGIEQLYSHQAEAFGQITAGKNTVIVTPTASGKTLCYNLPVLQLLLNNPSARAFYLFPTKALAEDQLHELQATLDTIGSDIKAFTYDGDTPQDARRAIRERAQLVLTNPDMLHAGMLPHHTKWAKAFENLRYIIIDELHYYRGVYGSHLANLLRRLKRIAAFYGSAPQVICCSATIANPRELAEAVTEQPFELVDQSGAPSGDKFFVFYNPPFVNKQLGIRRSYLHESRRIAEESIERGQQTLVFCNNRLATEILVKYLKDSRERGQVPAEAVRGYRGGYLPRERREIERKLRDGSIQCVVATNALELGIDLGSLDTVILAGYPGTVAATWQRGGRAGRRQRPSLAIMIASSAPLDQYMIEHPDYFFGRSPESAHINANNLEILLGHLKCAAFELPIREDEKFGPHEPRELCEFLAEAGFLHQSAGAWHWTSDSYPADAISLRAVSSDNFIVIDTTSENKVIAEVSFPAALVTLHEKAIYLHEARIFQVEKFDYDGRKAYVRRVDCDYYTDAIDHTQVKSLEAFEETSLGEGQALWGDVRVNTQIVGFKKIKFYTNENIGSGHLSIPEQEIHTTAFWLHFPAAFLAQLGGYTPTERQAGILGLANAMRTVGSLLLMCDPRDLGVAVTEDTVPTPQGFEPNIFLYDAYPGGIGQSQPLYAMRGRLMTSTAALLRECPCEEGCPSCVGPLGEVGERGKEVAQRLVALLSAGE